MGWAAAAEGSGGSAAPAAAGLDSVARVAAGWGSAEVVGWGSAAVAGLGSVAQAAAGWDWAAGWLCKSLASESESGTARRGRTRADHPFVAGCGVMRDSQEGRRSASGSHCLSRSPQSR